jgi:transcriptional regulator of acetoin/glycerol metabolism
MESLTLVTPRPVIGVEDLPPSLHQPQASEVRFKLGMTLEEIEREMIRLNLDALPTIKDAARALGVPLRTFHDKLKRYGLRKGT